MPPILTYSSPTNPTRSFTFTQDPIQGPYFKLAPGALDFEIISIEKMKKWMRNNDPASFDALYGAKNNFFKRTKVAYFIEQHSTIWAPTMRFNGTFEFVDGRHRFAILDEDFGFTEIPINIHPEQREHFAALRLTKHC